MKPNCFNYDEYQKTVELLAKATEKISELETRLNACNNELCYMCGRYRDDACGDCKWRMNG